MKGAGTVSATSPRRSFAQHHDEHPHREQQFGQSALEQCGLAGHPVPDLDDRRLAGGRFDGGARRSRQHQNFGFLRHAFRNRRHDRRRRARIRRIMLADDDDFSGLLHHGFRNGPHGRRNGPKRSGGVRSEFGHGILEHRADGGTVIPRNRLLQRREPFAQGLHRRLVRLGRHDAGDADLHRSAPRWRTGSRSAARPAACR